MPDTALAHPTADTAQGRIEGRSDGTVARYLGIPYGRADRFRPARPPAASEGVFAATALGPRCPQVARAGRPWMDFLSDPTPMDEACLALNIFAADRPAGTPRPVMVWLHGGGYVTGSGGRPGVDGTALAARGDVVVVTLNHRLNAFGFTYFGDLVPGHNGANIGMTDIVRALEWVRENIAAFGGDPGNVTIFGQSGGGSKVALLMAMPSAEGLFHRAVVQSASSLLKMASPERATRCAELLLEELGIADPTPEALAAPDFKAILDARARAVTRNDGIDDFRPVVDGTVLTANPFEPGNIARSARIPLLIGTCEDEITFFQAAADPNFHAMDAGTARDRIAYFTNLEQDAADRLYAELAAIFPGESPAQLTSRAMSEHMYRRNDRRAADLRSAHPGAPVWSYLFRWKTAAEGGHLGCPHTACIPFIFGTTTAAQRMLGRPDDAARLSEKVMDAWLAFARSGDPNHPGLPAWPAYDATHRPTMIFDDTCEAMDDPLPELRALIDACPAYTTDKGSGAV
ncbi:carboxylesterase/lipase family protein [Pseudooceanicola sp. LIPI14-2-Ac024]|uniref:carboxylesterase/lipase family protein n=1 Tax=Pseudooceanicola sp. LIPI14-2-Ac024 TaxID=3344875 RepID=UPI0035CF02B1